MRKGQGESETQRSTNLTCSECLVSACWMNYLPAVWKNTMLSPINTTVSCRMGFPQGLVVKHLPANAGELGLIPGSGRYPKEWNGNSLQYSCLRNPMDRGAWWATIHQFSSVQSLSQVWFFVTPGLQHARLPCPSPTPRVYLNSCLLSQWSHPTISSSVVPFSSCLQSFQASGPFHMSQLFRSVGQSIGVSASTSILPVNIQDWLPLGWTGWISLQSKGLSRVLSNTTLLKQPFFSAQLSM